MTHVTFFGSDQYSVVVLSALLEHRNTGKLGDLHVVTDLGRDNPVQEFARDNDLPTINYQEFTTNYHELLPTPSLGLLASFGHILPANLINHFPAGILCLHPSLLPQYRNASPAPYTIALGDKATGITLFRISEGIDNGEILAQTGDKIRPDDTSPTLLTRLFGLGSTLLLSHFSNPTRSLLVDIKLDHSLIFTKKLTSESGHLEWEVAERMLANEPITKSDTENALVRLRLSLPGTKYHKPGTILTDLIRALTGWEKVWTVAPTRKGDLRISFSLCTHRVPCTTCHVLLPGKPSPIMYTDFVKYYLE